MSKRLRLILLALFSSMKEVQEKIDYLKFANNRVYAESVKHHLDNIKHDEWELTGVTVESNKEVDITEIRLFMTNAPYIVKNLLAIIQDGKVP